MCVNWLQTWLRVLQRYSLSKEDSKSEVQQIRSLSLSLRDGRLQAKGASPNVFCLLNLDGVAVARTIPVQLPCVFDECYHFQ